MLEIVVLIFLTRYMGQIAEKKGLKPGMWKLYTVLGWVAGEIAGVLAGMIFFGKDIISIVIIALAGAVTGFLIVKAALNKKPDLLNDDINRIGTDDLRP